MVAVKQEDFPSRAIDGGVDGELELGTCIVEPVFVSLASFIHRPLPLHFEKSWWKVDLAGGKFLQSFAIFIDVSLPKIVL